MSEVNELSLEELETKLIDLKQELFNLRFQHTINQLENPNRLPMLRKDIARVKTAITTKSGLKAGENL